MAKQIKKYSKVALIIGLSIALIAAYLVTPSTMAGTLGSREVKLTDTRLAATGVDYDFLATESAATPIGCIKVSFCDAATGTCNAPASMNTIGVDTGNEADWNNLTFANWAILATTSNSVTASTTSAEVLGTGGSWVFGNLTNSNATNTYFASTTTYSDTGCSTIFDTGIMAFAIISGVTVSATIAETLNVTVNASTCDTFISGGNDQASATTSIGFGTVGTESFYNSCQRIDIGTNASNGYNATVRKTQLLTSGGDTIADGACDGACTTASSTTWGTAANNGFGYCMKDRTLSGAKVADAVWGDTSRFCGAASQNFKIVSNTTTSAESIMQSNSATSTNEGWIGYRLSVDASQIAGTYTTEIIYVVTPNF